MHAELGPALKLLVTLLSVGVLLGCATSVSPVDIEPTFHDISFASTIGVAPFQSTGHAPQELLASAQDAAQIFLKKAQVFKEVVALHPEHGAGKPSKEAVLKAARARQVDLVLFGTLLDYRHTSRIDPFRGTLADVTLTIELAIYDSETDTLVWKKADKSTTSKPHFRAGRPEVGREIAQKIAVPGVTASLLTGMVVSLNKTEKEEQAQELLAAKLGLVDKSSISAPAEPELVPVDVDEVPSLELKNPNAYAVVVGIESYRDLPRVDFATRDAETVKEYLVKTLGYPEENVIVRTNDRATRSDLESYFERWLNNNVDEGAEVFVYYAGHGAPDPKSGRAFLVPFDGNPSFLETTGYSVERLYQQLGALPAERVIVALDSCFSGAGGRSVIAKGARPLMLTVENTVLASDNMIVLAAAQANQISSAFPEKRHGLFTYFLLKGIQGDADTNQDGAVGFDELYTYLRPQVQRQARRMNQEQTPELTAAPALLKANIRQKPEAHTE